MYIYIIYYFICIYIIIQYVYLIYIYICIFDIQDFQIIRIKTYDYKDASCCVSKSRNHFVSAKIIRSFAKTGY